MTDLRQPDVDSAREWARRTSRRERVVSKPQLRLDVQGLRAFAVLAVILDHLTGWPGGGFVGVDIFFVISGFLITGLLLREHERTDSISFRGFYIRRFKRIIPASVLVIVATTVTSFLAFSTIRFEQVKTDAIWALLFSANWHYAAEDVDYFNADRAISPLQHYWSLGIEEQFYFVWPWLMLGIFAVLLRGNRSRRAARLTVGAVMGAIVVGSFAWACAVTGSDAHRAYFSTFTRVWELGVGAGLAVAIPLCARIPDAVRPALAWVGLAGMVAAVFVIDGDRAFPAPAAALPVLATALVIAAGTFADQARQQARLWPLTNRGSAYIGDMSYSLYLWHFPIIIIGAVVMGDSAWDNLWLLLAIGVVSWYSYVLVERPIHRSRWLLDDKKTRHKRRFTVSRQYRYTAMSAAVVAVAVMVAVVLSPPEAPRSALSTLPRVSQNDPAAQEAPELAALQDQIREALGDTEWPNDLTSSVDEATEEPGLPSDIGDCSQLEGGPVGPDDCAWGPADAEHTAMLVGDSIAMAYADMLRSATLAQDWRFLARVTYSCPFVDLVVNEGDPTYNPDCPAMKAAAIRDMKAVEPDVLFVVNYGGERYWSDWQAAAERQLSEIVDSVGRIVFVAPPPPAPDPTECFTPSSSPADCTGKPDENWLTMKQIETGLAATHDGLWIDSEPWFCYRGLCPPYVGRTPVRPDIIHMLLGYSDLITPAVTETLVRAGVFRV